jgi:hypothetical protein
MFRGQKVEQTIYWLENVRADVCALSSVIVCDRFFYFIKLPLVNLSRCMDVSTWWERSLKRLNNFEEFQHVLEIICNKKI